MATSNDWTNASATGGHSVPKLSDEFRLQGNARMVWEQNGELKKEALGLKRGDTCTWNKTLLLPDSGVPQELSEEQDPPRAKVKDIPASAVIKEYGNATDWTGRLEDLSKWNIQDRAHKLLMEDQVHVIEYLISSQFLTAKFTACVTGALKTSLTFTTNGTIAETGTNFLNRLSLIGIGDYLEQKQTPKFGGMDGTYRAILSVACSSDVRDDVIAIEKYASPNEVLRNEVGMVGNIRVMMDNGRLGNLVTSENQGVVFGDDAVSSCIAKPSYMSYEPGKHKRSGELAWFTLRAYAKTWDLTNDDLNSTGNGIERIVRIGSVAS